jgi:hypothetical protein
MTVEMTVRTFFRLASLGMLVSACSPPPYEPEPLCEGWVPGDVVLTELLADPEGVDTGQEWLEVYNPGRVTVNLQGLTLYVARADGSHEKGLLLDEPVLVEPGDYGVLGDVRSEPLPAHVDFSYGGVLGAMGNTGGVLGLRCGATLLDEVHYSGAARSGLARAYDGRLPPDPAMNDDESRWCAAPASPGAPNPACAGGAPWDGGMDGGVPVPEGDTCVPRGMSTPRSVRKPRPGELILTELMPNPRGDDALGEWVELLATAQVDLNGVTVGTEVAGTPVVTGHCVTVQAGQPVLIARRVESTLNGGLPAPVATFGVDLRNASGAVVVRSGDIILDGLVYGSTEEGVALQVSADKVDIWRNDDPASRCPATEPYGTAGNLGSPGRANRVCPPGGTWDAGTGGAPPGSCEDPVTRQHRPVRAAGAGALVLTEYMADPGAVTDTLGEWVELYAPRDVDLNGVTLTNEAGARTTFEAAQCLALKAGTFALLSHSTEASANGGLPSVLGTFSFALGNGAGTRWLRLSREGTVLDEVSWTSAALPGVSMQLDTLLKDPARNDAPGSFCPSPEGVRYGAGDRGTPGAENRRCGL